MDYSRFNLIAFINKQMRFSRKAFGPDARLNGVIEQIAKELVEVKESGGKDASEWADVIILALDGAWRSGHSPRTICAALDAKLNKNMKRTWPDWRMTGDRAIEHVKEKGE